MVASITLFEAGPPLDVTSEWFRLGLFTVFAGENAGASIISCLPTLTVTRIDETHLQVDFSDPVLAIPTLEWPGAYLVTPSDPNSNNLRNLTTTSVSLGTLTPGTTYDTVLQVTLTTDEQGPTDYDVTVFGLEADD